MGSGTPLFTFADKRGIIVVCSEAQWQNHIVASHPETEPLLNELKDTIRDPDIIYKSDEYDDRDVYFRTIGPNDKQMKAIVHISHNYGEVITAFPRKGVRGNIDIGVIRYVKPKL